ncbi:MAG: UDP-N-acetylmuramate dehydrogenase [Ruminococcus sp.]|nr:UDP-N-acetylmuramate dehydrogenase [Ruminococcus sp.]
MNNNSFIEKILNSSIELRCDVPMKDHTTFRIGGPVEYFITVNNLNELKTAIGICKEYNVSHMILGNGSNLLVSDKGLSGAVLKLSGEFKEISHVENTIRCGAGVTLSKLCTYALKNSLSGLEFAYGIPGTVGGAVYMNAGAYGGEMKDVLKSVTYLTDSGELVTSSVGELKLSYRYSIFKENSYPVLFAEFTLSEGREEEIKNLMDDIMNRRVTKQPLDYPSAGSVFKRPEGAFAGALIEECGFKGYSVGGAQVSEKHSGFIVNKGGATCEDVLTLVKEIQEKVLAETGFTLEREIILL